MGVPKDEKTKSGDAKPLSSKELKELEEKKKAKRVTVITIVAVAVALCAALYINSGLLRRDVTAVSIGDVNYTVTDFNYYYYNSYYSYYSYISQYLGDSASSYLPDTSKPLKSQVYDKSTGETWAQFLEKNAITAMQNDAKIYSAALKANYKLSDDDTKAMNSAVDSLKSQATTNGYKDFSTYLKAKYGQGMNEASYLKDVKMTYIVNGFTQQTKNAFNYSDSDLESYYQQNKDKLDTFKYRYFLVSAASVNKSDYENDDAYKQAQSDALAAAKTKADKYLGEIKNENGMVMAAAEYDSTSYASSDSTLHTSKGEDLSSDISKWVQDASRKPGDVDEIQSSSGYYVIYFVNRNDNHYNTVNMRQFLVTPATVNKSDYSNDETGNAYNEAVAKAQSDAETKANSLYKQWTDGGPTEDSLKSLISSNASSDSDSSDIKDKGGLYENIYNGQMATEVNSWLYDSSRKAGDYSLISAKTDGYHIVYYIGQGKLYSNYLADTDKRNADLTSWENGLSTGSVTYHWAHVLAGG